MRTYAIHESNYEKMTKKVAALEKRCEKIGCSFYYKEIGEDYEKQLDGTMEKYVIVEFEATAIINDWIFLGSIHSTESGNIIHLVKDMDIPEKYKTEPLYCEHCNTNHRRKTTYLVYNTKTNEYKQVGINCLHLFTNGITVHMAKMCEKMEETMESFRHYEHASTYVDVDKYMQQVVESVSKYGYHKKANFDNMEPTCYDALENYKLQMDISEENKVKAEEMLEWGRNVKDNTQYIKNLKILCNCTTVSIRDIGILASLPIAYKRCNKKNKQPIAVNTHSRYIGEIGDNLDINVSLFELVNQMIGYYGFTYVYKFIDKNENEFIWYTTKIIPEDDMRKIKRIKAKVKDHKTFNGTKQTIVTRCKII